MTSGNPGIRVPRKPSSARSTRLTLWVAAKLVFGSRELNSFHFCPRAASRLSLPISRPRLLRSARSIASLKLIGSTPLVALPSGTLPEKGLCEVPLSCDEDARRIGQEPVLSGWIHRAQEFHQGRAHTA